MKTIKIYQLRVSINKAEYKFQSYDFAKKHGFDLNDYTFMYGCIRDDYYTLDDVFAEFNMHRPSNFTGHSLSVSDIVEMEGKIWYCDEDGWSEVENE